MWGSIGWIVSMVLNLAVTIVTARLLAPEIFGLVAVVMVIIYGAQIFADSGLKAALVHEQERLDDAVATASIAVPAIGLAAAAALFAFAPLLADFYGREEVRLIAMVLSGVLFIQSLSIVPDALIQRRMDFKWRRGVVDPLSVIIYGAVVITLAVLGAEEWSLVAGQYALFTTITIGAIVIARPNVFAGKASIGMWRRMARYGRPLLGANILEVIDQQVEPVTLGRNVNATAVGLYNVGFRLALLPLSGITYIAAQVLFPALTRVGKDAKRFREALLEVVGLLPLFSIPACITLAGLGEPAVVTLFGERWREAGVVLQILVLWTLGLSISELSREIFKASGRTGMVARNAFLEASTLIALVGALWIFGQVGLVTVALSRLAVGIVAVTAAAQALVTVVDVTLRELLRQVRPAVVGGIVQWIALFGLAQIALDGFETWTYVGSVNLGPVIPLLMLGGLTAAGLAAFVVGAEATKRGVIRGAITSVRSAMGKAPTGA